MSGAHKPVAVGALKDPFMDYVHCLILTCGAEFFVRPADYWAREESSPPEKMFSPARRSLFADDFLDSKALKEHIGIIQRNAIESWTKLGASTGDYPSGNDEGTAEVARECGLRHLPNVATSDHGTPLLGDLFRQAEAAASFPWMCYVNADIILLSDFMRAAGTLQRKFPKIAARFEAD